MANLDAAFLFLSIITFSLCLESQDFRRQDLFTQIALCELWTNGLTLKIIARHAAEAPQHEQTNGSTGVRPQAGHDGRTCPGLEIRALFCLAG
jgi:hypothetical protein